MSCLNRIEKILSAEEYSDIHCQISEDLQTLKNLGHLVSALCLRIDQGSGCIIEFQLTAVSKVCLILYSGPA